MDGLEPRLLELTWAGNASDSWRWDLPRHRVDEGDLDRVLAAGDLGEAAARHPSAVIDLLRLAADLGCDDWLAARAEECLRALPRNALGLLRPSDLPYLRKALPPGAYAAEFAEVEESWRGGGPAPNPTRVS